MYVVAPEKSLTSCRSSKMKQLAVILCVCLYIVFLCKASLSVQTALHKWMFIIQYSVWSFHFTIVRHVLEELSMLFLPLFIMSAETFPTMPCLVAEKHEHHVLLSVLVDLSQPRLVMRMKRHFTDVEHQNTQNFAWRRARTKPHILHLLLLKEEEH